MGAFLDKLVMAAYASIIVSYSSIFFWAVFNWKLHRRMYDPIADAPQRWFRVSWTFVSAGATLTSLHGLLEFRISHSSDAMILVMAQACLILAAVAAQTGFQVARQGSSRVFWFSLAVPVIILLAFVVGSL